jgi:hypothetical protein
MTAPAKKLTRLVLAVAIMESLAMAQAPYPPQPPYGQQPPYAQQAPYPQQGQYPPQSPYPQQGQYPPQSPYPQQGQYPPQQQQQQFPDDGAAPDRGVARISFMNGNVSVRRGDSGDLVAAILNAPLMSTDRLVTADGARAEVEFDGANLIRLGAATEVRFSELSSGHFMIQIAAGTTTFRVLRDSNAQVEISTPSVSVRPTKRGIYRVTVKPDGTSEITVRGGEAEIFSPKGSEQLTSGKTMQARGTAADPEFQVIAAIPQDEFDQWSATRDHDFERANSPRNVSRDIYGAEDLDPYGRWTNDPQYGNVWVPQVDPGWAPYQCGRWVWLDYYGWTWVGCEPWAWAPYHYGRWYYGGLGWAWYPGPVFAPYYWRPALVGFFGFGAPGVGVGFGFGFGNVGWVALAPFERFTPWYGRGVYGGFRGGVAVNDVHVVNGNVSSMYRNARVANGVTGMNAANFGRASVNSASMARASTGDLARAGMVRGQLPVAPSRESTQFTNRAASTQGLPRTNENAHFVSRSQPASVEHVPFEQQRQSMNQMSQRAAAQQSSARSFGGGAGGGGGAAGGGWQRFDPSRGGSAGGATGGGAGQASRNYGAAPQSRGSSAPQAVRINPPIVQNRTSGGSTSSSRGGTSGGGARGGSGGGHGGSHR